MGEWSSCRSKTRYNTDTDAERAGKKYGHRDYFCEVCEGFHLTHQARLFSAKDVRKADGSLLPSVRIARARKALAELDRKNIKGLIRDAAEQTLRLAEQAIRPVRVVCAA